MKHECEKCGEQLDAREMRSETVTEYPWDGSDTEGSIGESVTRWYCSDQKQCRENRRGTSKLMQSIALHNDASARESGAGAIGGGAV